MLQMNKYLAALEIWLNTWRLVMATHKCSFTIYLGNVPILITNKSLQLKMFSDVIPQNNNPKYLGLILDRKLNFIRHAETVRHKCFKLLNILKCLAYKSWAINVNNQITIYKTLIRSCMEYASPLIILRKGNIKLFQGIQYHALRIIFKAPFMASSTELHQKANLCTVSERLFMLSKNYLAKATISGNPLISLLLDTPTPSASNSGSSKGPLAIIQNYTVH
jgi:hypothetical protein